MISTPSLRKLRQCAKLNSKTSVNPVPVRGYNLVLKLLIHSKTPVMVAGEECWTMNCEWLYEIDSYGETPLTRVCKSGRMEISNVLFLQGIDDTLKEMLHLPPLHRAAYWGYTDAAKELLSGGADVDELDVQGETALHKAVRLGNREVAELLIETGADVNARNAVGLTPLHWAVLTGQLSLAELLVDTGADLYVRDWVTGGMTPLDFARLMRYKDLTDLLSRRAAIW